MLTDMPWSVALKLGKGESFREGWQKGDVADVEFNQMPDDKKEFPILASIDPYYGALFTGQRIDAFLNEWNRIGNRFDMKEDRAQWNRVQSLAARARKEGLELWFIGD
jgi:hypothetical protein